MSWPLLYMPGEGYRTEQGYKYGEVRNLILATDVCVSLSVNNLSKKSFQPTTLFEIKILGQV